MADMTDEEARTFGHFRMDWCPGTHAYFPQDVRAQIKTVLQGSLTVPKYPNDPSRKDVVARHPGCDFTRLPKETLTMILEYIAGSSPVHPFFKTRYFPYFRKKSRKSKSKTNRIPYFYHASAFDDFKIQKPMDVNGIILEFRVGAHNPRPDYIPELFNPWLMVMGEFFQFYPVVGMTINGLSVAYTDTVKNQVCGIGLNIPEGVNSEGWKMNGFDWFHCPTNNQVTEVDVIHTFYKWRLVLRPYGENVACVQRGWIRNGNKLIWRGQPVVATWNNGVGEHEPCSGMGQDAQGASIQLPCKVIHDLFHTEELSIRPFARDRLDDFMFSNRGKSGVKPIAGDLKVMFF